MIQINDRSLSFFTALLKSGTNFKFLKFGDGEFLCAVGEPFTNGEFIVHPEITADYRQILANLKPEHYNALQPLVLRLPHLLPWVPEWDWCNADILHNASIQGELFPFFDSLQDRNVVLICNDFVGQAAKFFANCNHQILIEKHDCYHEKEYVMGQISKYPPDTVFLISAAVMSEPVIYYSREDCTFIDTGSIFEPYLGAAIRDYHKDLTEEAIKQNLGKYFK